jgi:hypothetical protein
MWIEKLTIKYDDVTKGFHFSSNRNLIQSSSNSVGKTTLLRIIFWSLGFNIPGTKKMKFNKLETSIVINIEDREVRLERSKNFISYSDSGEKYKQYLLPEEEDLLHEKIFLSSNSMFLKNVLGVLYIDQEKGWVSLNKGAVIGGIRFNAEEFISALSEVDIETETNELAFLKKERKQYKYLENTTGYRDEVLRENKIYSKPSSYEELSAKRQLLTIEYNEVNEELSELEQLRRENVDLINFIENMDIYVTNPIDNTLIKVEQGTLANFDENFEYITARYKMVKSRMMQLKKKLIEVEKQLDQEFLLVDVESSIEKFNKQISMLKIDQIDVERIIKEIDKQRSNLEKEIIEKIRKDNNISEEIYHDFKRIANDLSLEGFIGEDSSYLLKSELKSLSGAILHKLIFAFRVSFHRAAERYLGMKLPFVIDSPSGRELDDDNLRRTLEVLKEYLHSSQIIIASIHEFTQFPADNVIRIDKYLLEDSE